MTQFAVEQRLNPAGPLIWKELYTWYQPLTDWLAFDLRAGGAERLRSLGEQDICWDDCDWLDLVLKPEASDDIETIIQSLGDELDRVLLRTYHGCRLDDAGVFHREGLLVNDPTKLENEVRRIVAEEEALAWMRPSLEDRIAAYDFRERDTGKLYLCLDDRPQLDHIGHYALYGSEWISAFLPASGRHVMRSRGVPTIVECDIPLSWTTPRTRDALARAFLQEWTRQTVNSPNWLPARDFSIILHHRVPPEHIVGHYHPAVLKCPFEGRREHVSAAIKCPSCAVDGAIIAL